LQEDARQLRAAGDIEGLIRMGLLDWEPLPDWITYLTTAENMTCPPWDLFEAEETPPPKWWWREARMIFDAGRNEGEKKRQAQRK
jgi:hypothetical protein